jgi:hypothetical protein
MWYRVISSVSVPLIPATASASSSVKCRCSDAYANEQQYKEALAKLGTSALGIGRLWITDSKITHANDTGDNKLGTIQWMKFTLEIKLPDK